MSIELKNSRLEFEQHNETERKLLPHNPEAFDQFRVAAMPIEQIYLSVPDEGCSLRVRKTIKPNGTAYSATLKAERELTSDGVSRFELETKQLSEETYRYFANNPALPRVRKLRAEMSPGITIDWIDGIESPLIEIEQGDLTEEGELLAQELQMIADDVSDGTTWDNDQIAYRLAGLNEQLLPEVIDPLDIVHGMVADLRSGQQLAIATISGMSGSGKTTLAREVAERLAQTYPNIPAPILVSTDDYHRGKTYLEETYGAPWTNWDRAEVYDTASLAADLVAMRDGTPFQRRHFDFSTQEPAFDDRVSPSPFVIIEGIRAATPDLDDIRTRHYALPTPFATCLLRDVKRVVERPSDSIGTAEERLLYTLTTGLPTYLAQHQPPRERFSESVRPIGTTALEWLQQKS